MVFHGAIQAWQGSVMVFPAKIAPSQWVEIERRATAGESTSSLAREFGVSESSLRKRGIAQGKARKVREVAQKLVAAQEELAALPVDQQHLAVSLAEELRAVSANLARAARFGSATAQRLAQAAHDEIQQAEVLDEGKLRAVAMLTRTANEAGQLGVQLLRGNEDMMREAAEREAKAATQITRIALVPMQPGG
jgi:transposase-like protein